MSTAGTGTQPAAERKAAEAELRRLIEKFALQHARLIAAARRHLRTRLPSANELVYEYRDAFVVAYAAGERGHAGIFALRGDAGGVKLYFNHGKGLPDPERLLSGTGQTRWIMLDSSATLGRPGVAALIDGAIARNHVPFPKAGRGAVIVRPTSAKVRPQRGPAKRTAAKKRNRRDVEAH